jgi:hypothetical protein
MADTNNMPEGTDSIIDTATRQSDSPASNGSSGRATSGNLTRTDATDSLIKDGGDEAGNGGIRGMFSNATDKIRDEAGTRVQGFVGQGLERGSATLSNISTLVGDTAAQIEEKLGPQYGGYARTASETLTRYADTLKNKNPDELVDDARELVRKSPGIALGAAAIVGFGLIRLIKAGIDNDGAGRRPSSGNGNSNRDDR